MSAAKAVLLTNVKLWKVVFLISELQKLFPAVVYWKHEVKSSSFINPVWSWGHPQLLLDWMLIVSFYFLANSLDLFPHMWGSVESLWVDMCGWRVTKALKLQVTSSVSVKQQTACWTSDQIAWLINLLKSCYTSIVTPKRTKQANVKDSAQRVWLLTSNFCKFTQILTLFLLKL